MTEGINYAGDWTSGTTYFKGDLVRWNNASYLLVAGTTSGLYTTTNPSAIPTVWKILVNAPSASVLNASGGMIFRDNDDTTNVQLPIGALGSQLSVIEKPLEDIANEGNYEYTPVLLGGTRNAWLTGDGRETYEAVTYTVTVAAAYPLPFSVKSIFVTSPPAIVATAVACTVLNSENVVGALLANKPG